MEARGASERTSLKWAARPPSWVLGAIPIALIAVAVAVFATVGGPTLGERRGPPVEQLVVERAVLHPGEIVLSVRNEGPDAVSVAQVVVNDSFVGFSGAAAPIGRLGVERVRVPYPWIEGEAYEIALLTSSGGKITHAIPIAVETPEASLGFFGLMALLGIYVGVIPVMIGLLWLPFVRRIRAEWLRAVMALTIGLLAFLAIDALIEGVEVAGTGSQAFGGPGLVFVGALLSYLALAAIDASLRARRARVKVASDGGRYLALLVAIGIGLHNLGEGLAIGSAYAVGALALGAFLVIGFAIHNTTEGLAIVAPTAASPPSARRLVGLGLIAGAPAILGAWIGAAAFNTSLAALLLGAGVGAIVQVIQQLAPSIRDGAGRLIYPASAAGIAAGMAILYVTGLLVSI